MASMEKYTTDNDVECIALKHDYRESPNPPRNEEIDPALSESNYCLHPSEHGQNASESFEYYKTLIDNSYLYGRDSSRNITRCVQWCIQAPADLPEEQKSDFFKVCNEYVSEIFGEENVVSAIVHKDEILRSAGGIRVSKDHIHIVAVPRTDNPRFLTAEEKLDSGIKKMKDAGILSTPESEVAVRRCCEQLADVEIDKNSLIRKIAKEAGVNYTDARRITTAVIRTEAERHEKKIDSSAFTSRRQLHEFHGGLQNHLDQCGIKCTVAFKAQGIDRHVKPYTVTEAKTVTRVTGYSVEQIEGMAKDIEQLREHVAALTVENDRLRSLEIDRSQYVLSRPVTDDVEYDIEV